MSGELNIEHGGERVQGYLAEPEGTPRAGMIVIQEWWGLNDDIRGIAERFAAEGYLAVAPDLYDGQVSTEPDEARKLAMALERDVAGQVVDAAIGWLKAERGVAKVGCIGFCMGGGLTMATAMRPTSQVDAVHVFYGGGIPPAEQISAITVPVMGSYGRRGHGHPGRPGRDAAHRPREQRAADRRQDLRGRRPLVLQCGPGPPRALVRRRLAAHARVVCGAPDRLTKRALARVGRPG